MNISFSLVTWVSFISTLLLSYGISQGVASKYFLVEREKFTWRNNVENVFILLVLSSLVFIFGNYNNTFPNIATVGLIIIIPIAWTMLEKKFDTKTLNEFDDWDSNQRKINFSLLGICLILILAHIWIAKSRGVLGIYLFYFFIAVIIVVILFLTSTSPDTKQKSFHLHHWLIGWILAFFTRFTDSTWSELGAGFALGVFVHSFSVYRDNLSFYDCKVKSYIRCNDKGPKICESDTRDNSNDYQDSNWYSILIIAGILWLVVFGMFMKNKYSKKRNR